MKTKDEKLTQREAPERYVPVRPHGCCRDAKHGTIKVIAEVCDDGRMIGVVMQHTCCGHIATPALGEP